MCTWDIRRDTSTVSFMVQQWCMEPGFTIAPGSEIIIIRDPGHGDSISVTIPGMAGVSGGGTIQAGLIMDLGIPDGDSAMAAAGGGRPFITPLIGEDGMAEQDLTDTMEIPIM